MRHEASLTGHQKRSARKRRRGCRAPREEASLSVPCPANGRKHVLRLDSQFRELGTHRIAALKIQRREHDAPALLGHLEICGSGKLAYERLGQSELVLAGELGNHEISKPSK